jgi:hypothetical protein
MLGAMRGVVHVSKRFAFSAFVILTLAALSACGGGRTVPSGAPTRNGSSAGQAPIAELRQMDAGTADAIVDPSLPEAERKYVSIALRGVRIPSSAGGTLPIPQNYQVVVIDAKTGELHYNRAGLRGTIRSHKIQFMEVPPDRAVTSAGHERAVRDIVPLYYTGKVTPDSGAGAYRRVFTVGNYDPSSVATAFEKAHVTTFCNSGNLYDQYLPDGDYRKSAGFSYLGGWSASLLAVDSGLQYNKNLTSASGDDYSPIMRIATTPASAGTEYDSVGNQIAWHIPCSGFGVDMAFYVSGPVNNGALQLELIGQYQYVDPYSGLNQNIFVIYNTQQSGPWLGWDPVCYGCVFKRMTSLAHKAVTLGGPPDDFGNGDEFHATWSNMVVSCGFAGFACSPSNGGSLFQVSQYTNSIAGCQEYPVWTMPYDTGRRDCTSIPANAVNHVSVSNFTWGGEQDDIVLNPPASSPSPPGRTDADACPDLDRYSHDACAHGAYRVRRRSPRDQHLEQRRICSDPAGLTEVSEFRLLPIPGVRYQQQPRLG